MFMSARPSSPPLSRSLAAALLSTLCIALALLAAPAIAGAAWNAPVTLPESGEVSPTAFGNNTYTVVDRTGTEIAVWDAGAFGAGQILTAAKPRGGEWSEPTTLVATPGGTPVPGQLPNVATSPDGSTTVVWAEQKAVGGSGVWAATRSADGTWGAPVNISASAGTPGSTGAGPRIVIDQAGNTTVVWQVVFNLYSVTKPAGGSWGAPVEVWTGTAGQDHGLSGLGAAVDANGGVTVVWRAGLNNNNNVVYAKRRASVGGAWGSLEQITVPAQYYYYFEVAASSAGTSGGKAVGEVTVAFSNGKGGADGRIYVATREGDGPGSGTTGTWGVKELTGGAWLSPPDVAYDSHGRALVAFNDQSASPQKIVLATREDGAWSAVPETIAVADPGTETIADTDVVADTEGNLTATWVRSGGAGSVVQAARRAPGGAWSAPTTLSSEAATSIRSSLAVGPTGDAFAVWGDEASGVLSAGYDHTPAVRTDWTANGLTGALNLRTWINYLGGNVGTELSAGALRPVASDPYSFRFAVGDAWIDGASGETVVANQGTLRYTYPSHFIDTRIVNPRIRIAADGESGVLVADGQASGTMAEALEKGELVTFPFSDRTLLRLDLANVEPVLSADGEVRTWARVPVTIAAEGEETLQYSAGSAYGFITVSVPADLPVRNPDPGPGPGPGPAPQPGPSPAPAPPAAVTGKPSVKRLGKQVKPNGKGLAGVVRVSCPAGGGACAVKAPKRVRVKIGGQKLWAKVLAPKRLGAGKSAVVRVKLSAAALELLGGKKVAVTVTVRVANAGGEARS